MSKKLVTDLTTMQIKSRFTKDLWYIYLGMLGLEEKDTVQHKAYAFVKWMIQKNAKVCLAFLVSPIVYLKLKKLLMESYNCYKDNSESKFTDSSFEVFFNEHFTICELLLGNCIPYERFNLRVTDYNDVVEAKMEFDLIVTNPPYAGKGKPLFMEITKTLYENCLTNDGKLVSINPTSIVDKTFIMDGSDEAKDTGYNDLMVESINFDSRYSRVFGQAEIKTGICVVTYSKKSNKTLFSDEIREKRFGKEIWQMRMSIINKSMFDENGVRRKMIGEYGGFFSVVDSDRNIRIKKSEEHQRDIDKTKESIVIISQLTGGKKSDGTQGWDWVTLHSEPYFNVGIKLPDIHYHAIPFNQKQESINLVKWINTDFIAFIVNHYKFNVSNTQTMMNRLPQPPMTNGDFSDDVIRKTFGLTQKEIDWIHEKMKNFGWKVSLNKTESQLMDYIDEINK